MNTVNSKIIENDVSLEDEVMKDILLDDLAIAEDLTARAVNTCLYNQLQSLINILDFYQLKGSFKSLRNCGKRTDLELQDVCKKYLPFYLKHVEKNDLNEISYLKGDISLVKNTFTDISLEDLATEENLTVRAVNTCLSNELHSLFSILDYYKTNGSFLSLKNCGKKTDKELTDICSAIIVKIQNNQIVDKFHSILKNEEPSFFNKTFKAFFVKNNFNVEDFFDKKSNLKIFSLLDQLIRMGYILNNADKVIFNSYYNNQVNSSMTLETIGKSLNLTSERVRQRKERLSKNIHQKFSFVSNFEINEVLNYGINGSEDLYILDNSIFDSITLNENVPFKEDFFCFIFAILLKRSHVFLGGKKLMVKETKQFWKFQYLIKGQLCDEFDFEKLVDDIYYKINDKINEHYTLHFKGYLFDFFKTDKKADFDEVYNICTLLIFSEFNMIVNYDGYLEFEQNTKKVSHQYFYEILEENQQPMTLHQIIRVANIKFPFLVLKESTVRSALNREKHLFIPFGRSSTYGLCKWEDEKENIKGGSIRDIVEEYLLNLDQPQHITIITKYVEKYRNKTYAKSILGNIKADESLRFVIFESNYIGLKSKNYSNPKLIINKIVGSRFTKNTLIKYNNWDFEDFINFYAEKFDYQKVQVEYVIQKKIDNNEIIITDDNKIKINE